MLQSLVHTCASVKSPVGKALFRLPHHTTHALCLHFYERNLHCPVSVYSLLKTLQNFILSSDNNHIDDELMQVEDKVTKMKRNKEVQQQ